MKIDLRKIGHSGELSHVPMTEEGNILAVLVTIGRVQYELSEREGGLRISVDGGLTLQPLATNAVVARGT
jgi:hypothetical protein